MSDGNLMSSNTLSSSITILGVCHKISDDKDTAYQCYNDALQCESYICATAEESESKPLMNKV